MRPDEARRYVCYPGTADIKRRRDHAGRIFDKMKTLLAGTSDPSLLRQEHMTCVVFRYPPGCFCQ